MKLKDRSEKRLMHTNIDNRETMIGNDTDEIMVGLSDYFLQRYQIGFKESMKCSDLVFYCADSLFYKCHKISLNCGGSYIYSPE